MIHDPTKQQIGRILEIAEEIKNCLDWILIWVFFAMLGSCAM